MLKRLLLAALGATFIPAIASAQGQGPGTPPPQTGPAYTVAYVDVLPASRAAAIDEFRKYREATSHEAGFLGIDVFEQNRRGAHYTVIEAWANAQALDAHDQAAPTAALLAAMKRIAVSGYDQRPYKALTIATPRAGNPQAVYVVTHVDTIPAPGSDPAGILRALAERSRAEAGNLRFDVLQHAMRANHFTIVERWENPAAADAHEAAAHTRQYRLDIQPLSGSPLDERVYRAVE